MSSRFVKWVNHPYGYKGSVTAVIAMSTTHTPYSSGTGGFVSKVGSGSIDEVHDSGPIGKADVGSS